MKQFLTVVWFVTIVTGILASGNQLRDTADSRIKLLKAPPLTGIQEELISALTLGHKNLYDDFVLIWTIQILTDPRLGQENPNEVYRILLDITEMRPRSEILYILSCATLSIDLQKPELCEKIMLNGLKAHPESWRIPALQGFVFSHYMNDIKNAAMYIGLAASRPGSPAFFQSLAGKLVQKRNLSVIELQKTLESLQGAKDSKFSEFLLQLQRNRTRGRQL